MKLIIPVMAIVVVVAVAALRFGRHSSTPEPAEGVWELAGDHPG